MGVQVSFGFGNLRLILRAAEGHTTGGGTDDTSITEALIKDSRGNVLGCRRFIDALDLVEQICPGVRVRGQLRSEPQGHPEIAEPSPIEKSPDDTEDP